MQPRPGINRGDGGRSRGRSFTATCDTCAGAACPCSKQQGMAEGSGSQVVGDLVGINGSYDLWRRRRVPARQGIDLSPVRGVRD
jgi:hypothetical protein